jgi:hypothetical protein
MTWESVACCDECWWQRGNVTLPIRMQQEVRPIEYCHFCGWTTYCGIYIRIDTDEDPAASLRVRRSDS